MKPVCRDGERRRFGVGSEEDKFGVIGPGRDVVMAGDLVWL